MIDMADIHRGADERTRKINTLVGNLVAERIAKMRFDNIFTIPPPASAKVLGLVWHVTKGQQVTWEDMVELSKGCAQHSFNTRWSGRRVNANSVYSLQITQAGDGTYILYGTACWVKGR